MNQIRHLSVRGGELVGGTAISINISKHYDMAIGAYDEPYITSLTCCFEGSPL